MTNKFEAAERSLQLVADYQEGASVAELAKTYGVSDRWVYVILKEAGIKTTRRRRRPLSPLHYHIAVILREDIFDMGVTNAVAANRMGWTYQKLSSALQGTAELTILDLQTLSTFLKREYNDLMTTKRRKLE